MKDLEKLLYTTNHEWVRVEGTTAYIGVTDFAQHAMGDIVYVELPEIEDTISIDEPFGVVESVKAASDVFAPLSGVVIEVNEALEDSPELINEDPFETYLICIEISDAKEVGNLLDYNSYLDFCEDLDE